MVGTTDIPPGGTVISTASSAVAGRAASPERNSRVQVAETTCAAGAGSAHSWADTNNGANRSDRALCGERAVNGRSSSASSCWRDRATSARNISITPSMVLRASCKASCVA
jgi:hypothetical protein